MIVNPKEMTFKDKKIRALIAGFPGIGKTTLALSAPKPLYIDVDLSAERIDSNVLQMAVGVIQAKDYATIRNDLGMGMTGIELESVKTALSNIETIVIDTGGKLLNIMGLYGAKLDPKNGKRDGSLSLQGYGWLGKEFSRFLDHIIYELDKHIVIVFHAIEDKDGEDTKLRIKAEGSSKNSVWEVIDLGGFMEMRGNDRTIGFSNCERYFAKGTRGVHGVYKIPELGGKIPNDFLSKLFIAYNEKSAEDNERAAAEKAAYESVMAEARAIIEAANDLDTINAALKSVPALAHATTSKKECSQMLNNKAQSLGLMYDSVLGRYTPKPTQQ